VRLLRALLGDSLCSKDRHETDCWRWRPVVVMIG
jgi:hypothetical protein